MKKLSILVFGVILIGLGLYGVWSATNKNEPQERTSVSQPQTAEAAVSPTVIEMPSPVSPSEQYDFNSVTSLQLVVNKSRPIDLSYIPADLRDVNVVKRLDKSAAELKLRSEAAGALERLFESAIAASNDLLLGSAYRSADLQNTYYTNYVATFGQAEADKFSARPGTSEHQIGLAADVSPVSRNCYLETCFANTPEGVWVANNAHLFGFVVRYPEGKEAITGYQYEPWHLRYLGVELATELFESKQTLEEYIGL